MIRTSSVLAITLACTLAGSAAAQVTATAKQLSRIDIGVSAAGQFTETVSGPVLPANAPNAGQTVGDTASNTVGAQANIRYTVKPLVGVEFNFVYARYTENYSYAPYGVQTNADEYTLGYIITPGHTFFGLQPFASVGLGTMKFKPTPGGGQNLNTQARAVYYYSLGVQQEIIPHFGLRAGFRQTFYLAPDYGENYLTIKQHTITSEPTVGVYARF